MLGTLAREGAGFATGVIGEAGVARAGSKKVMACFKLARRGAGFASGVIGEAGVVA